MHAHSLTLVRTVFSRHVCFGPFSCWPGTVQYCIVGNTESIMSAAKPRGILQANGTIMTEP